MDDLDPLALSLHRAGYRLTEPRLAVTRLIGAQTGHFSAADLAQEARTRRLGIGRATIFRTLDVLSELGAVERIDLPSGEHAYVGCAPTHHHHVICSRCGQTAEIEDAGLRAVVREVARRTGFRVDEHRLELFGLCATCQGSDGRLMSLAALVVSFGAFASAFAGGWLAISAVRYVGIVIAVGAGIRIGAAFFDLIPEAIAYLGSVDAAMLWTAVGFLAFYAIEKLTTLHVGHETAAELDHDEAMHTHVGMAGAIGMGIHSFLDGVALAAGLAVGGGTAVVIAVVVIVHRFSDGIGVVSFLLASRMPSSTAYRWLTLVAVAPIAGVLVGVLIHIEQAALGAVLAFFAGFFLYVGAAELLPEAHRRDRSRWIVVATIGGAAAIYLFSVAVGAIGVEAP